MNGRYLYSALLAGFIGAACVYVFFLEPWGHDTWYHIQRMLDIAKQLSDGDFYAHFAGNAASGKGLPVWIYYSQWIYWPSVLLKSFGAGTLVSLKIVYCVLLIVCGSGCYHLLRLHADRKLAALGSLVFITSNYVIGEIFQRSAYAEFFSVAFLPFLLVGVHRTLRAPDRASVTAVSLLSSVMILAHPLSFMNAGWALLAYTAYVTIQWRISARRLLLLCAIFLLALALTAFYWLPAVTETRYVLGAEGVPTPLNQTFMTIPRYFKFYSILSLGFVLTACAIATAGGVLLRRPGPDSPRVSSSWPLVTGIFVYVLLTLRVSEPLYDNVPFLASNLWVWRVLFPLTLLVVLFVVTHFRSLPDRLRDEKVLNGVALLTVIQGVTIITFYTWSDLSVSELPQPEISAMLAEEMDRLDGFGVDEYLPQPRELPRVGAECLAIKTLETGLSPDIEFFLADDEVGTCLHIPRYWNIRYAAFINGKQLPMFADSRSEILLVPEGNSGTLTLRLTRPHYVTFSAYLSVTALVLLFAGLAWRR